MSGVNNVTFNYQEYKAYVKNNKSARLAHRSYSMNLESGQEEKRLLGSTDIIVGMTAAYDDNFTSESPIIKVTTDAGSSGKQEYLINIDEIDVNAASDIEMFALCSYADAHEKRAEGTKSSWDSLKEFVEDDDSDYTQKKDWLTMVKSSIGEWIEAKQYRQVTDGNQLTHLLEKYGMPKEVEMIRIDENTLVPVDNGTRVQDVDGGYAQILFENNGTISYENHLNSKANWTMEVSREMLKKARQLDSEFSMFMSDKMFWESFLNGDKGTEALEAATDYQTIRSDFLEHIPESVRRAWEQAETETGIDGLGIDENGELLYPSEFMKQYMLAKLKGEGTQFFGNTEESILEFARQTLSRLQDTHQPKYNADLQRLKDKEILFYQNLVNTLA